MNLDHLGSLTTIDPTAPPWPAQLISALPASARPAVDKALAAMTALDNAGLPILAPSPADVARDLASRFEQAAIAGDPIHAQGWAAEALAAADAETLGLAAAQIARTSARQRVMDAVRDAVPEALAEWTGRVREIAAEVDVLLGQGATTDELAARRGTKADVTRWECLTTLLAEYDAIRVAFGEARYLVDRSDQQDRFALGSAFQGVLHNDGAAYSREREASGHPLIAGVRLGWTPWCPTRAQQLADEQETIRQRVEGAPKIPGDIHVG